LNFVIVVVGSTKQLTVSLGWFNQRILVTNQFQSRLINMPVQFELHWFCCTVRIYFCIFMVVLYSESMFERRGRLELMMISIADLVFDDVMPIEPWTSIWVGGVTVGDSWAPCSFFISVWRPCYTLSIGPRSYRRVQHNCDKLLVYLLV